MKRTKKTKKTKKDRVDELSTLLETDSPYRDTSLAFSKGEVESLLKVLGNYDKSKNFKIKGKRPKWIFNPSESTTNYRKNLADYIELNTGIKIAAYPGNTSRLYDDIADFLGL